jgi:hypothetical protein
MKDYRNPFLADLGAPIVRRSGPLYTLLALQQQNQAQQNAKAALFQTTSDALPVLLSSAPAAYPAAGATTVLLSYRVPAGAILVVQMVAVVNIGTWVPDNTGNVIWHVLRNGAGVRGFENLYAQVGTLQQPQLVNLLARQNETISITVTVPVGGLVQANNTPAARLVGFTKLAPPLPNLLPRA